jgi:FkbM family methyltransferase
VRSLPDRAVFPLVEWRHARHEPELRRLDDFVDPGRAAVDVGAWRGPYTRALARRVPRVHAVEPQPALAAFLRRVAPANVTVHEVAVGATRGRAELIVDERPGRDALARLGTESVEGVDPRHRAVHDVPVVPLDELGASDVGFLKIDVEGRELDAIAGAADLLTRDRPAVLLEVEQRHLDHPITDVFDALHAHGLRGWFLRDGWQPLAAFDLERDQTAHLASPTSGRYVNNFLFLPGTDPPGSRR